MSDAVGSDTTNVNSARVNYWTHIVFPARTLSKEIAYWVCEIVAAILFLIIIFRMDFQEYNIYKTDDVVNGYSYKLTSAKDSKFGVSPYRFNEGDESGIPLDFNTHILNNEYGWICLCYAIKHLIYFLDTLNLMRLKFCLPQDLAPPILNCALWVLWMLYGFFNKGYEVYAGVYERYYKDNIKWRHENGDNNGNGLGNKLTDDQYNALYDQATTFYKDNAKWTWLWVPSIIVCAVNFVLFILGFIQKRSSAFTNATVSAFIIPLQLFFLHLFLKGSFWSSNYAYYADMNKDNKTPTKDNKDDYVSFIFNYDYYEARWVFFLIYIAAWIGLLFAVVCLFKAFVDRRRSVLSLVKYVLYAIFLVACFLWCLALDKILWQVYIQSGTRTLITIVHIVGIILAIIIGAISIMEKKKYKDEYYTYHVEYKEWHGNGKYNH